MAKLGFFGIPFKPEYEGAGGDSLSYILAVEELSKVCATTGVILLLMFPCASVIDALELQSKRLSITRPS